MLIIEYLMKNAWVILLGLESEFLGLIQIQFFFSICLEPTYIRISKIMSFSILHIVLQLYANSEHVVHESWKIGLFGEKITFGTDIDLN